MVVVRSVRIILSVNKGENNMKYNMRYNMKYKSTYNLILILGIAFLSLGAIISIKDKDTTSKDIPLKFKLQKTLWDGEDVYIWGKVKNKGTKTYKFITVTFTAYKGSKFVGRDNWCINPGTLKKGNVGYINKKFVNCEKRKPTRIEYKVMGTE